MFRFFAGICCYSVKRVFIILKASRSTISLVCGFHKKPTKTAGIWGGFERILQYWIWESINSKHWLRCCPGHVQEI